jgi:hypothetical protein
VTFVLYLNERSWANGGELVLHPPDGAVPISVVPASGRLVVFESTVQHEVLPLLEGAAPRCAMTVWMDGELLPSHPEEAKKEKAAAPGNCHAADTPSRRERCVETHPSRKV